MWLEDILSTQSESRRTLPAIVGSNKSLTYAELSQSARSIAGWLKSQGFGDGARGGILCSNTASFFELLLGITASGMIAVPMNHRLPDHQLSEIISISDPAVVFVASNLLPHISEGTLGNRMIISLDGSNMSQVRRHCPIDQSACADEGDRVAMLISSSATGGDVKAATHSHRGLSAMTDSWLAGVHPESSMRYLHAPPVHHSTTTIALSYLRAGATVVVMGDFSPRNCMATIEENLVTHAYLVPTMIEFILKDDRFASSRVSTLDEVFYGGSPIRPDTLARARARFSCGFRNCYGQAEAGPITVEIEDELGRGAVGHEQDLSLVPAGRPLPGIDVRILDRSGPASPDPVGEVVVRGDAIMSGYWGRPELTQAVMDDGWLRTGDLGRFDDKGASLYLVGRSRDLIVRGGQNVYPESVEEVIRRHPGIDEVSVLGVPDDTYGEVPLAFAVRTDDRHAPHEMLADTTEELASHERPVDMVLIDQLPRNASGKVLKEELRRRWKASESDRNFKGEIIL